MSAVISAQREGSSCTRRGMSHISVRKTKSTAADPASVRESTDNRIAGPLISKQLCSILAS